MWDTLYYIQIGISGDVLLLYIVYRRGNICRYKQHDCDVRYDCHAVRVEECHWMLILVLVCRVTNHRPLYTSVYRGLWTNKCKSSEKRSRVNPRPAGGGGGVWTPPSPSGFSRLAKIRRRAAPPGFHPPYPSSFPQLLWKFRPNAMWGQVTRSGQVTQLQNKFPIAPRLQCFRESYESFGIWWGHQCLQNVYLGFFISVTSGQVIFATSPL